MNKIIKNLTILLGIVAVVMACQDDYELDNTAPSESSAEFTITPSDETPNKVIFSTSSEEFIKYWDLGNGSTGSGSEIMGTYPNAGVYLVSLTVYNGAGSVTKTKEVNILQDDPTLLDNPLYNNLTGGIDAIAGRTWYIDSTKAGHFGLGPNSNYWPEYYQAEANAKGGYGLYNDRFTFKLAAYGFEMNTQGQVYVDDMQASSFPGAYKAGPDDNDFTAPYEGPENSTWSMVDQDAEGYPVLTLSKGNFLGFYTGVNSYQIQEIDEKHMLLRYKDASNEAFRWYLRLIPTDAPTGEDPDDGPGEEPTDCTAETGESLDASNGFNFNLQSDIAFGGFEGVTAERIENPFKTTANPSCYVNSYIKASGCQTYSGAAYAPSPAIDFSNANQKIFKMKVYAVNQTTDVTLRLERQPYPNADPSLERAATITQIGEWQELTFDFSDAASDLTFSSMIVYFDKDQPCDDDVYYFDDLRQVQQ